MHPVERESVRGCGAARAVEGWALGKSVQRGAGETYLGGPGRDGRQTVSVGRRKKRYRVV